MKLHELKTRLNEMTGELQDFADNIAPEIIGRMAADFYKESFQNEGFTDKTLQPWQRVKRPNRKTVTPKILVKTGNLKRSIDYKTEKGKVTIHAEAFSAKGFNYAPVHNFGTERIPQRMFVGESETLNEQIIERLKHKVNGILRK
jgi:phage gpG-like protein